jgi:hypothetical protein
MSLPLGIQLATAALAASVPRYILAFLMADGVIFGDWQWIERSMQVVSAIATAVTVSCPWHSASSTSRCRAGMFKRPLASKAREDGP